MPRKLRARSWYLQGMQYFARPSKASCLENNFRRRWRPCNVDLLVFSVLGTRLWGHCARLFPCLVWLVSSQKCLNDAFENYEHFLTCFVSLSWSRPIRMFNRSRKLVDAGENLMQKQEEAREFFSNPNNFKLGQQYLKIFIAYLQVFGSFMAFDVQWPAAVISCISWVRTVSSTIEIDLLELPGLACPWTSYSYETKFHVKMAIPLIVSVMLAVPVRNLNLQTRQCNLNYVPSPYNHVKKGPGLLFLACFLLTGRASELIPYFENMQDSSRTMGCSHVHIFVHFPRISPECLST